MTDNLAHPDSESRHGSHAPQASPAGVSPLLLELREHIPFSVSAVALGLIFAGAICILGLEPASHEVAPGASHPPHDPARLFFHLFHPAHMLFSAAATAAMFTRYEHKIVKAVIIGLIGSIGVCGISDIAIPQLSLMILGKHTPLHVCVWQHPDLVLPFAFIGVIVGVASAGGEARSTIVSHSLHVLTSTMASIFYMVGPLGLVAWIDMAGKLLVFITLAVVIPCCVSDIVFPLLMSHAGRHRYRDEGGHPHGHGSNGIGHTRAQ